MKSIRSRLVVVGLVGGAGRGADASGEAGVGVLVVGVAEVRALSLGAGPDGSWTLLDTGREKKPKLRARVSVAIKHPCLC